MSTTRATGTPLFRIASQVGASTLPAGRNLVTIKSIVADERRPSKEDGWLDATPQVKIVFANEQGMFTDWYSLCGYARFDKLSKAEQKGFEKAGAEGYAVNKKTKERLRDDAKTLAGQGILGQLIGACGIEKGEEATDADLIGCEVGIVIKQDGDMLRARSFYRKPSKGAVMQEK